ncbi:hypothetical protein JMJ56_29760 [Belnapia sp. T18]|uniref:Uncharacterized protein n=1 Tax=Belnapia arida TaxID=2804533 RepID=A0ABS1UFW1_9PROT|nr:hypothetical protein [Belnapia arida]MBL6082166.1 hypothetical protein [Belnapia arida]
MDIRHLPRRAADDAAPHVHTHLQIPAGIIADGPVAPLDREAVARSFAEALRRHAEGLPRSAKLS